MRGPPDDFTEVDLAVSLEQAWHVRCQALRHVAIGGGSYHWIAECDDGIRRWVTVDDLEHKEYLGPTAELAFDALRRAFETALALRDSGLEFVLAPVATVDGCATSRVNARYAASVFPYLADASTAGEFGVPLPTVERAALADMLAQLHGAPRLDFMRTAPVGFSDRFGLEQALAELDRPWASGPYGEAARQLLVPRADAVVRLMRAFDALVAEVAASGSCLVITHGEPHPTNVLMSHGRLLLIDWDTVGLAPPERDLWLLGDDALPRYTSATGRTVDPAALRLYRLRWLLDDLSSFLGQLRQPHLRSAQTEHAFNTLSKVTSVIEAVSFSD